MKKLLMTFMVGAVILTGCGSKGNGDSGTSGGSSKVTITIDGNGVDFKEGAVTEIKDYDIEQPLTIHEEHYFSPEDVEKFKGWTIDDDTSVISGQKIPVEKDITLHAQWEE